MITLDEFEKHLLAVEQSQLQIHGQIEQKRAELAQLEHDLEQTRIDLTPYMAEIEKTVQVEKLLLAETLRNSVIDGYGACFKTITKAGQFVGKLTIHDTFKSSIKDELTAISFVLVDADYLDSPNTMFSKLESCETWKLLKLAELTGFGLECSASIKSLTANKQRMQQKAARIAVNVTPKRTPTDVELSRVNADPSTFMAL